MSIGLVCPACDALIDLGATACSLCGTELGAMLSTSTGATGPIDANVGHPGVKGDKMSSDMRTCATCGHVMPATDKFCGGCGSRQEDAIAPDSPPRGGGKTMFFSAGQLPGRAKLILVRGDQGDGVSYQLNGTEHIAGREEGAILFDADPLVSPRHANFYYVAGKLHVRDEGSVNGVFTRIKQPAALQSGSVFLVGEQLLQIEAVPPDLGPQPDAEGTYFYSSPRRESKMKLIQILRGGDIGLIYRARSEVITIGRENCDVNFPDDPFISGNHAEVRVDHEGNFQLVDCGSKNGTFVRIEAELPLFNGDYVFLGQQLLRIEVS
jgi:pSer/pThr/pTyr-binding forkhead associated (FHA) protein/RNA polymerase subunit RPABC4/transcription elongation factor Spt4